MNLATTLYCFGTSEGVRKAWDTRGRGRKPRDLSPPTRPLAPGEHTKQAWSKDGVWDKGRAAWQQRVVDSFMYGKTPPVGRKPIIYIMGGGTASGKSTASKKIIGESKSKNFVRADPDDIKLTIPEYEGLKNSDPDHAGFRVHDESSHMTKMLLAQAGAKGLDIIYDSTTSGDTGPETIKQFQSKGYDVRVMFFDAPMKDAIAREEWRSKNSDDPANFGRRVPMHIMVANHVGAAKNFMGIKDLPGLTAKQFYDTTQREPKLVYDRTDNAGETIHDEDRWQRYQRKAGGDVHASVDRLSRRPVSNKSGHRRVQAAVGRS